MRDDLKELFSRIINELTKKTELIRALEANEDRIGLLLKSDNIDELHKILTDDEILIDGINAIDARTASLQDTICRTAGIPRHTFNTFFISEMNATVQKAFQIEKGNTECFVQIMSKRDLNIKVMSAQTEAVKRDIEELSLMRRLKYRLPGS